MRSGQQRRFGRRPPLTRGDEDLAVLIHRAAAGDRAAESAFVARTIDDVWRYCSHMVGTTAADDATQATFIRALRSLSGFRGESSPKTWLIGVARNTCLDERRSAARRHRLAEHLAAQPIDDPVSSPAEGLALELDELVDALTPDRREAFVLTQVLGFGYAEAAEMVGCPIGTVRSRVARARADLLAMVEDGDDGALGATMGS